MTGLEESRWSQSTDHYRTIQALVREGRREEALDRGVNALLSGQLGRKTAARIHSLLCWLYTQVFHRPSPAAALHGEEAVRLAELIYDPWIKCEALARLVHAYCQLGDISRARATSARLAAEVKKNATVLPGGATTLLLLQATVAATEENWPEVLAALEKAEKMGKRESADAAALAEVGALARAWLGLSESHTEQAQVLVERADEKQKAEESPAFRVHCLALQARLEEKRNPAKARRLARITLQRSLETGRLDLTRQVRRTLGHLLWPTDPART